MKLKELLKIIPEDHILNVYDSVYEGDTYLKRGTKNDVESDYLDDEVKEIFGTAIYDDFENDDELDGTDILMIYLNHKDRSLTIPNKNRELEKAVLKNAGLYNKKVRIDDLKISTRLKHNLIRGGCLTIGDILNRIFYPENHKYEYNNWNCPIRYIRFMGDKTYNELLSYLIEHAYELSAVES